MAHNSAKAIHLLENYQAILVSQPFLDHCHEETIRQLKEGLEEQFIFLRAGYE